MMETMGKPDKDLNEVMKHICDVVQKRIDDAYKRGINDGSLDVKQRVEGAYQKGLEDGKDYYEQGCKGCKWEGKASDTYPCSMCRNSCKNMYERKDDDIKVGDEVTHKSDSVVWKAVCIQIDGDGRHMNLMGHTGAVGYYPVDDFKKTGRHFDIDKILEEMKA